VLQDVFYNTQQLYDLEMHAMKAKISFTIDSDILERFKNAMYWTPGYTMSGVLQECMRNIVDQLEEDNKQQFLPRMGNLRRGLRS
jgi:hypothetical protein